jgi:ribosomal protein S18 acetylase RimI-like enzyme
MAYAFLAGQPFVSAVTGRCSLPYFKFEMLQFEIHLMTRRQPPIVMQNHSFPIVRVARAADADSLAVLARALLEHEHTLSLTTQSLHPWAASPDELRKQLQLATTRFFVAETETQLVGYLKVVLHGRQFTRAELGWRPWLRQVLQLWAKAAFDKALRRPRANITPLGGYIAGAYVLPTWRRSHVGQSLVSAAENWLREHGMPTSELHVLYANESARAFWANLGYEPLALGLRKKL